MTRENNYPGILNEIYAKYKQNTQSSKKIIAVFDTTFGEGCPLDNNDMKCFLEDILKLGNSRQDIVFILKLKNRLSDIQKMMPETFPYYKNLEAKDGFYFLDGLHDPGWINAICDLNISACFTSTFNEAIGVGKKAIFFDAASSFRGYYYDRFPNIVAHGYDELVRIVDHWLYEVKDEEFSKYLDEYIKAEIDPYTDGRAITRFRELLITS